MQVEWVTTPYIKKNRSKIKNRNKVAEKHSGVVNVAWVARGTNSAPYQRVENNHLLHYDKNEEQIDGFAWELPLQNDFETTLCNVNSA